jgi:hypothetical protein
MTDPTAVRGGSPLRTAVSPVRSVPSRLPAPYRFLAAGAAAVSADVAFDPAHRHVPLCPFHAVTGLWCPLCGGLRAVAALVRGQLTAAVRDNLLVVAAVPVVAVLWLMWVAGPGACRAAVRPSRTATIAVIALALGFTVVRNLPGLTALRP